MSYAARIASDADAITVPEFAVEAGRRDRVVPSDAVEGMSRAGL